GCHHAAASSPVPMGAIRSAYYLRLIAEDVPGVLGALGMLFGQHGVSILSFVQKEVVDGRAELVFVTHTVREQALFDALEEAKALPHVREVANLIRVEEADHA
ncbi:MAG TPA: ACT domain-containing protein, partial [Stenomitos sp.]